MLIHSCYKLSQASRYIQFNKFFQVWMMTWTLYLYEQDLGVRSFVGSSRSPSQPISSTGTHRQRPGSRRYPALLSSSTRNSSRWYFASCLTHAIKLREGIYVFGYMSVRHWFVSIQLFLQVCGHFFLKLKFNLSCVIYISVGLQDTIFISSYPCSTILCALELWWFWGTLSCSQWQRSS